MRTSLVLLALALTGAGWSQMDPSLPVVDPTRDLASADSQLSERAVEALRSAGPEGVDAALAAHPSALEELRAGRPETPETPETARFRVALDRVAGQYDAWAAGLYWHTDLSRALARAAAEGKLVLSLRLLGRLDEELSCANSRFFRTALYADESVSAYLRERYVLHWQTVRPAPRITIDYGDGRILERTITGNSLHLVLDASGRALDVLPGLYAPATFLAVLRDAVDGRAGNTVASKVRSFGVAVPVSKMMVERRTVAAIDAGPVTDLPARDAPYWRAEAERYTAASRLGPGSLAVMRRHNPDLDDDGLRRMAARFEQSIALETAVNEGRVRPTIRDWIANGEGSDAEALVARIYTQLFEMPSSDLWLGLRESEVYSGLVGDGVRATAP